ncbi:MAG: hypothetical protein OXT09_12905 [Myxococcales bacterium]|nr:hypothetical protein [Myxococcales bacterium]
MVRTITPLCLLVCALLPGALAAQEAPPQAEPLRATIVHIDGNDVFVDVDASRAQPGSSLTVYRRVEVRHPVTRRKLVDRFPIGVLRVERAGSTLSLARVEGEPAHAFEVGDAAEAPMSAPPAQGAQATATTPAAAPKAAPSAKAPAATGVAAATQGLDPETRELLRYFYATLGKRPTERVALYDAYLRRHPRSRFVPSVQAELRYLKALTAAGAPAATAAQAAPARPTLASAIRVDPVTRAREGHAIDLAAAHDRESGVRSMILHARRPGEEGYHSVPMKLDGRGHARASLPAEVAGPEGVEYFVEAVDAEGKVQPVFAHAARPHHAAGIATGADTAAPPRRRTRVRFSSELVSFDGTSGRDYFLINEGDFLYRLKMGPLRGVRMGYGHYRGQGGTVEELDELELDPQEAGFSYGFAQADLELSELIGASLRATIGLGRPEQVGEQRDGMTGGFQLRTRIGRADGTHLVLAGELMPEIGQRAYLGLNWEAIERFPMGAEVHVTDQPVNSDELAVRLVYEVGYRFSDRFALALRPSYQLRTIKHAGPGIGMAATFDW